MAYSICKELGFVVLLEILLVLLWERGLHLNGDVSILIWYCILHFIFNITRAILTTAGDEYFATHSKYWSYSCNFAKVHQSVHLGKISWIRKMHAVLFEKCLTKSSLPILLFANTTFNWYLFFLINIFTNTAHVTKRVAKSVVAQNYSIRWQTNLPHKKSTILSCFSGEL